MNLKCIPFLLVIFGVNILATPAFASVWFVDQDNPANIQDGASWSTAFITI